MLKKFFALILMFLAIETRAAEQIKLAVLVPEGTTWGNSLRKLAKEVETITKGEVLFKIYFGGVAGDEPDVLRKIRIGQFHGGIFTAKTLGDINGDVRAIEIPFTFYGDQKKAAATMQKLAPSFNQGLAAKGFTNLGFYEVGLVYLVTTKKVSSLNELKGVKIWSWEGDELVKAMIESLGLVSIPLALPDVLSSLSTGIINAAYAPPLAILALQWQTKVKYLVDFPTAFSMGSLLISNKAWEKIRPEYREKVKAAAAKIIQEANEKSFTENEAAKQQLKKSGIEFVSFPAEDYKKAASYRDEVIKKLRDRVISGKIIDELNREAK